ncbi:unnamed protein product [Pylaiella littoralis]
MTFLARKMITPAAAATAAAAATSRGARMAKTRGVLQYCRSTTPVRHVSCSTTSFLRPVHPAAATASATATAVADHTKPPPRGWSLSLALAATATVAATAAAATTSFAGDENSRNSNRVASCRSSAASSTHAVARDMPSLSVEVTRKAFVAALGEAVGEEHVSTDQGDCEDHGTPKWSHHRCPRMPDVVVSPATTEEVVAIVKTCARLEVPMIPYGGATSIEGHLLTPMGGCSIDFSRMDAVKRLSKEDHDVTVQPGLGYLELNEMLKGHGLWFPLDPGPGASLGGMCSCSCSGSTAVRYGTMKDNVLSMTVVLADGQVVKTSSRAKKSSAGYDLTRLFVGSEGTLGIITEATLKVHKIPAYSNSVRVSFDSIDAAAKTVQDTLAAGIQIGRAELLDDTMVKVLNKANHTKHREATTLLFELSGESPASVAEAQSAVLELAKKRGGGTPHVATNPEECRKLWRQRKEALWSLLGLYPDLECMTTDVCVPVSRLSDLIGQSKRELDASPLPAPIVAHAGDGNFHALIMFDRNKPEEVEEADRLSSFMVHKALEMDGTCTGEHGVGTGKIKYLPEEFGPGAMHVMGAIKQGLDPLGLMNPGKVLAHRKDPLTGRLILCT